MKKIRFFFRHQLLSLLAFASCMLSIFVLVMPEQALLQNFENQLGFQIELDKVLDKKFETKQKLQAKLTQNKETNKAFKKALSNASTSLQAMNRFQKQIHHEQNPFEILERKEGPQGFEIKVLSSQENVQKLFKWLDLSQQDWSQEPALFITKLEGQAPDQRGTAGSWTFHFTYPSL